MSSDEEEVYKEFPQKEKKRQKTKDEILDETFIEAQSSKGKPVNKVDKKKKKKTIERPFLKTGLILIIIAIAALVIIEHLPWMYITYEVGNDSSEQLFYKDFENRELEDNENVNQTILNLFHSPCNNCSNNSNNFIGLTRDDFTNTPKTALNGFIALALIGAIFTVFVIIDKYRRFSDEIVLAVHSLFSVGAIIASTVILVSCMKFLGTYFLLYHNWPFIEISGVSDVRLVFLAPIILVILASVTLRGSITILKINFREMKKIFHLDKHKSPYSTYRYGSDTR